MWTTECDSLEKRNDNHMKKLLTCALFLGVLTACGGDKTSEEKPEESKESKGRSMDLKSADEIEEASNKLDILIKQDMPKINKENYINAINLHYQLSQNFPDHEKAAYHLDKAQGYCQQIKDFARSEKMLAQLFRDYPDYAAQKNGEMYYMRASNLDLILGEGKNGKAYKKEAKRIYSEFIEKFPTHPLVKDAEFRLETIDLTAEEIIDRAKKNS